MDKITLNNTNNHLMVDSDLQIETVENTTNVLIVDLKDKLDITVSIDVKDNSKLTLFFNNESDDLKIKETGSIGENSELKIAYCELESKTVNRTADYDLVKENGSITLIQSSIVNENKHVEITCNHKARHTHSEMETYGIVLKGGNYYMKANGAIKKGAKGSITHQTSRVLTFDSTQSATVLPMLLIDENEVEASHATSIGQLDENQLYYLMSRGLNEQEALKLMSLGYLLPITNVTDDKELHDKLVELIERKVAETCLM